MVYEGAAGKKHQNNDFYGTRSSFRYFWTCHFVKFERKSSLKLCKLYLSKEISYEFASTFLTFVYLELLYQMNGLYLELLYQMNEIYIEKLI